VRARRLVLLLALVLAAFAAWWLLRERGGDGSIDPAGVRKERADTAGPDLLADAPSLKVGPHPARTAKPRFVLTVRVLDLPAEEAGQITLHVTSRGQVGGDGESSKDVRSDPSGTTVIDVEDMALRRGIHTIQVMADGPVHLPAYDALALPTDIEERRRGLDLGLEVRPIRAGALVGRVVDPDGSPVAGVLVTPDVWGGFTNEEGRGYGTHATTDAEGRFRVTAKPGPRIVALTWSPLHGARASEAVALSAGKTEDVGTIRLIAMQHWIGTVRGLTGLPTGEVTVRATWIGPTSHSEIPGVGWTRDGLVRRQMAVTVGADGRFEVPEVTPGWWKVSLEAPDWGGCSAAQDVMRACDRIVHTRDGALDLDAARARLLVKTTGGGRPLAHAKVLVVGEERLALTTDDTGSACLVVRPQTRYEVVAFAPGFQALETTVTSAANGKDSTLALELVAGKDPSPPAGSEWTDRDAPRVSFAVGSPVGGGLPAELRLTDADGRTVPTVWVEEYANVMWRSEGRALGQGAARLMTLLPPGEYRLRVERAGFRSFERALSFPQGNTVPVAIPIELEPE
jgi:hypothetical protein